MEAARVTVDDVGTDSLMVRGTKTKNAFRVIPLPPGIAHELKQIAAASERTLVKGMFGDRMRRSLPTRGAEFWLNHLPASVVLVSQQL